MNSQPAWWKSGRWNNPDLLSRVISGKRRFSIFSRRTGKTWRGVSEGFFSHPFEFLIPTLIRRYFRLSRRTEFPDNPGHIPKTVDTAALTASFRFYRCGSSPPYPAKPIPTSVFCFSKRLLGSIPNPLTVQHPPGATLQLPHHPGGVTGMLFTRVHLRDTTKMVTPTKSQTAQSPQTVTAHV